MAKRSADPSKARRRVSAAQRKHIRQQIQSAKYQARRALRDLKAIGLYNPVSTKLQKSQRRYIAKRVKKFGDLLQDIKAGALMFVPTKAKPPKIRKTIAKQAKEVGFTATKKGVLVPGTSSDGTKWDTAKIEFNKSTKRFFVQRKRQPKKKGAEPQTSRIAFANIDRVLSDKDKLRREWQKAKRKGKHIRFIVYGRGLSRNVYTDFDQMLEDFENHYYSFRDDRSDFMTHLEMIVVDPKERRESIYDRLFRKASGDYGKGGIYIHYTGK